jgi:hypothetical protein
MVARAALLGSRSGAPRRRRHRDDEVGSIGLRRDRRRPRPQGICRENQCEYSADYERVAPARIQVPPTSGMRGRVSAGFEASDVWPGCDIIAQPPQFRAMR